jgi:hypothetical protein
LTENAQFLCDGIALIEGQEGASLNWLGTDYPCVASPELGGKLLGNGGYRVTAQQTLVLRLALLPSGTTLPEEKNSLTFKSTPDDDAKTVRIDSINRIANAILVMECNAPSQG